MASGGAVRAYHSTLTAAAVDVIRLSGVFQGVEILIRGNPAGTPEVYATLDGLGGPAGDGVPTVGGADCYVITPALGFLVVPSRYPGPQGCS